MLADAKEIWILSFKEVLDRTVVSRAVCRANMGFNDPWRRSRCLLDVCF